MAEDIKTKYRPSTLDEVGGNQEIIKIIKSWGNDIPQGIMLVGPSGCGKTTIARILASLLPTPSIEEHNAAFFNTKEAAANMASVLDYRPIGFENRVQIIDEAHRLTKGAQDLLLKPLEDCKPFNYTIVCTTEEASLEKAFRGRLTRLEVKGLNPSETGDYFDEIYKKETGKDCPVSDEFIKQLYINTEGSPRNILGILQKIVKLNPEDITEDMAQAVKEEDNKKSLVKALVNGNSYREVCSIIKGLKDSDVEGVRRGCLNYTTAILLNGKTTDKLYKILEEFKSPFYDSGRAGLLLACYKIMGEK